MLILLVIVIAIVVIVGTFLWLVYLDEKRKAFEEQLKNWGNGSMPAPTNELYLTIKANKRISPQYFNLLYAAIKKTWDNTEKVANNQTPEPSEPVRLE